jgi:hypothetical protein
MTDRAVDCHQFDEAAWLLLSDELDDSARPEWHAHLAGCGACAGLLAERRRLLDVYDGVAAIPDRVLDLSGLPAPRRRSPWSRVRTAAAAVLILAGGALAGHTVTRLDRQDALDVVQSRLDDLEVQLARARMEQPTAAERLKATATGVALVERDPRVLESLLDAIESDASPNVRMAIIEALYTLDDTSRVGQRFDGLLAAQPLPMLRVALIELAADRRLTETVPVLERVAAQPGNGPVRQRAQWAIGVLRQGI